LAGGQVAASRDLVSHDLHVGERHVAAITFSTFILVGIFWPLLDESYIAQRKPIMG